MQDALILYNGQSSDSLPDDPPLPALAIDQAGAVTLTIQDLIGQSVNIVGLKRSGKTNTGTVLIEEWMNHGLPATIIDRQNEYWGLAQRYAILIAGRGRRATIALDAAHAAELATFSFTHKVSVILCLLKYDDEERWAILQAYFERLYELAEEAYDNERPEPYAIVLEEARTYLPLAEKTPVKPILREIALGGGKYGLTTILLNQRAAGTDTDTFSQGSLYFLHRVAHPRDKLLYREVIPLPPQRVEQLIEALGTGDAIIVHHVHQTVVVAARIREQRTHHAGATPRYHQPDQRFQPTLSADLLAQVQAMMIRDCSASQQEEPDTIPPLKHRGKLPMKPPQETQRTLRDMKGKIHTIAITADHLTLDQQQISGITSSAEAMVLTVNDAQVVVSPENVWYAFAGAETVPTAGEAGQLLAEHLSWWSQHLRWQEVIRTLCQQSAQPLPFPFLPPYRLDTFAEAAFARCEQRPTAEKIAALAQILDVPYEQVARLLRERGKDVPECEQDSASERAAEEAPNQPEFETLSEAVLLAAGSPADSVAKRTLFRWSPEMKQELAEAFLETPPELSISAVAKLIAERRGWPVECVEYKIYHLHLQQDRRSALESQDEAKEKLPEPQNQELVDEGIAAEDQSGDHPADTERPVNDEPMSLRRGHFVWDIRVDGSVQRWALDYPYGSFPGISGQIIRYRDMLYGIQRVGTNTFSVVTKSPLSGNEESQQERQEVLA